MSRGLIRFTWGLYCLLTAAFAFTCASAFTYQELIRPRMFGVGAFSRWHALLYWPWLALMLIDLRASFRHPTVKRWALAFGAVWTHVGIALAVHPLFPDLADNGASIVAGVTALLPLIGAAALDHGVAFDYLRSQPSRIDAARRAALEGRWLVASLLSAVMVTVIYAVLTPIAIGSVFEPDLLTKGLAVGFGWNLVEHALIFCGAFLVIAVCARAVAGRTFVAQYAAIAVVLTAAVSLVVQRTVGDALGLGGGIGALVAISCGAAIVATWSALRLRTWTAGAAMFESPVDVFFSPHAVSSLRTSRAIVGQIAPFVAIAAAAWGLAALSRTLDWDFLLLRTGVIVLWFATLSRVLRATPAMSLRDLHLAALCVAPLALNAGTGEVTPNIRRILDRYTIYNATFRVADSIVRPPASATGQASFLRFVRANTGVAADVPPPSLDFVEPLTAKPSPPHVFLFVVDSLRPDYLAPYNTAVTFTPRIAEFAADSFVFRNAFTRFGGTGLSLPAIWTGAVGVHKQYIKPFAPMNTLDKLLNANRYQRVMSVDVIMEQLLTPSTPPIELDHGIRTMDYQMCRTLDELEARMPLPRPPGSPPLFGYSLPQDLHVSNIMSASVPEGESYPGFHTPYAARVHAIDRCFGAFIGFLKRHDLYDNSIVVLTSDHGEMLGEEGRWGHVYYLFPQILQVPLVMHVPAALRGAQFDPDAISFLTDITPTIYAALGYRPRASNRLMGEPLIGLDRVDAVARRRGDYVVAASYSAVYGVVRRNGHQLYIVDGIKGDEYAYERDRSGAWRRIDVTDGIRAAGQRLIREHLDEIRRVYHVPDGAETATLQAVTP